MNYNNLLLLSANGDQQAFKQLYDSTSALLFTILIGMLKDREIAEDILQEAYLKIWKNAAKYSADKANALTWMAAITRNVARDKLRSLKTRCYQDESSDELETLTNHELTPDVYAMLSDNLEQVNASLQDMKASQRQCLVMSCYQGYTHNEIAEQLNTSLGTIKTWIRRGKAQLNFITLST